MLNGDEVEVPRAYSMSPSRARLWVLNLRSEHLYETKSLQSKIFTRTQYLQCVRQSSRRHADKLTTRWNSQQWHTLKLHQQQLLLINSDTSLGTRASRDTRWVAMRHAWRCFRSCCCCLSLCCYILHILGACIQCRIHLETPSIHSSAPNTPGFFQVWRFASGALNPTPGGVV